MAKGGLSMDARDLLLEADVLEFDKAENPLMIEVIPFSPSQTGSGV